MQDVDISTIRLIPLSQINPFDSDHILFNESFLIKPLHSFATLKHRAIIDWMKICIQEGKQIRPICVISITPTAYLRLDGFCRYWAYKELGKSAIPCVPGTVFGEQHDMSPFLD